MSIILVLLLSTYITPAADVHFATTDITVGGVALHVEVAESLAQHARGLMFRQTLRDDEGMLFVYRKDKPRRFWMKNTYIPLSIGLFNNKGELIEIRNMAPDTMVPKGKTFHYPIAHTAPARYVLEVNKGWFERHGVRLKSRLIIDKKPRLNVSCICLFSKVS